MVDKRTKERQQVVVHRRWLKLIAVAGFVTAIFLIGLLLSPIGSAVTEEENQQRLDAAKKALSIGQFRLAEEFALSVTDDSNAWLGSRLVAGEAAQRDGRSSDALNYFLAGGEDLESDDGLVALFSAAEVYRQLGRLEDAVTAYSRIYAADPDFAEVRPRLAFLLGITGQRWEAMPFFLGMIQEKSWTLDSLAILADLERALEQPEFVASSRAQNPTGTLVQMAVAAEEIAKGNQAQAAVALEAVVAVRPELVPAQAMLGEVRISQSDELVTQWNRDLPPAAENHPDVWFVRGLLARGAGRLDVAAGCFARAVDLCPEHRRATYQLGQSLVALDNPNAVLFVERATRQMELSRVLDEVLNSRGASRKAVRKAAELSEGLGRFLEAWAWASTAASMYGDEQWPYELSSRVVGELSVGMPRTLPAFRLTDQVDLSGYMELATRDSVSTLSRPTDTTSFSSRQADIRFEEAELSPKFVFNNGADPATPGARMFEQTGGGVGVIDFDADGWPDLYFTQGNEWKTGDDQPTLNPNFRDALYRNESGRAVLDRKLVDRAIAAGIEDLEYSQGVAVGDFDGDGFSDLYVASVQANRLYRNNGDGTFADASQRLGRMESRWTTSCAMVDLTGDGLPELFDVNYVQGSDVFQRICGTKACSPKVFNGEPDQLYVNDGVGGFRLVDRVAPQAEAKGLGILVAVFGAAQKLGLFISNDQVPNFFLAIGKDSDGQIQLQDRALVSGVAYNVDGLAMACMGIAAEDLDKNGLLDLLVTNFADEPNSLYLQDAAGMFVDATRASGLQDPSYPYVGWGTQFLDADRDGESDLVVGNGHVDDYRGEGGMYQMPSQFFRNVGRVRFEELSPKDLGAYFQGEHLARGLARLDWNRDGLVDFAVSKINQPASLVTNRTRNAGGFLNVRLHGTKSERDPIGSMVMLETEHGIQRKQLVAGDGYMASNERCLQFGLGDAGAVKSIRVRWPSGAESAVNGVSLGATMHLIESARHGFTEDGLIFDVQTVIDNQP